MISNDKARKYHEILTKLEQSGFARFNVDEMLGSSSTKALLKDLIHHRGSIHSRWSRLDALVWILDIHAERQLDIEIEPFLLEQIEEDINRNPGGVQLFVQHCLMHLADSNPEAAQAFLEGVVALYVGPKAERTQRVEAHYDRRRMTSGSLNARIHHCFGLLRRLAQERDTFFWLTAYVEEMPPLAVQIRSTMESTVRNLFKEPDPDEFMVFLKSSPFLEEADRFSTLPVTGLKHNSLYACLVQNMLQSTDKTHDHFRDMVHRRVLELPIHSTYVDETSHLNELHCLLVFPMLHARNFCKRIFYNYFLRNFSIASINLVAGLLLSGFGFIFGLMQWLHTLETGVAATAGTVMLSALPFLLGVQLLLNFLAFDISMTPREALHRHLSQVRVLMPSEVVQDRTKDRPEEQKAGTWAS